LAGSVLRLRSYGLLIDLSWQPDTVMSMRRLACLFFALPLLWSCTAGVQPLAVALAGAGTSTAIGHSLQGVAYKTFTAPLAEVKAASLESLSAMGIQVDAFQVTDEGESIEGSANRRNVEIALEPISARATRMKVIARNGGLLYDGATATEIVLQTEKALAAQNVNNASAGASRRRR
jgi:hypothetical protein